MSIFHYYVLLKIYTIFTLWVFILPITDTLFLFEEQVFKCLKEFINETKCEQLETPSWKYEQYSLRKLLWSVTDFPNAEISEKKKTKQLFRSISTDRSSKRLNDPVFLIQQDAFVIFFFFFFDDDDGWSFSEISIGTRVETGRNSRKSSDKRFLRVVTSCECGGSTGRPQPHFGPE